MGWRLNDITADCTSLYLSLSLSPLICPSISTAAAPLRTLARESGGEIHTFNNHPHSTWVRPQRQKPQKPQQQQAVVVVVVGGRSVLEAFSMLYIRELSRCLSVPRGSAPPANPRPPCRRPLMQNTGRPLMEASARINPSFLAAQDRDKCCLLFLQALHQDSWQGPGHDISLAL